MKKIFLLGGLLLFMVTGCYSSNDKKYMNELKKQASENAIEYIQEKYGFVATVINTRVLKEDTGPVINFSPDPTGDIIVEMKYNNKKFSVIITGTEQSINGRDNYQEDEIINDILKLIENETGMSVYKYNIEYGRFYTASGYIYHYLNEKYDQQNIEKFVGEKQIDILLEYIDIDEEKFENIQTSDLANIFYNDGLLLVNYNSINSYNNVNFHNYSPYKIDEDRLRTNAQNIKNTYTIIGGSIKYYKFN